MIPSEVLDAVQPLLDEYKIHITGLLALGVLLSGLSFVINLLRLGSSSSNPEKRGVAIKNLLITACCLAFFGSISFFVAFLILSTH